MIDDQEKPTGTPVEAQDMQLEELGSGRLERTLHVLGGLAFMGFAYGSLKYGVNGGYDTELGTASVVTGVSMAHSGLRPLS